MALVPIRYQFAERTGLHRDDANWLIVEGRVRDGDLFWKLADPCLTTQDARWLSDWLRAAAAPTADPRALEPTFFTEPNVALEFVGQAGDEVTIVVSFSHESAPPGADEEVRYGDGHPVRLVLTRAALAAAADDWDQELARFPDR